MTVTNTIRDNVFYDNETGWSETPITNEEIVEKLKEQEKEAFLAFSWGCWVTAYGRYNIIDNIIKLDDYLIYSDTDSVKLKHGYDKQIIEDYNNKVKARIEHVSEVLQIPLSRFAPKDIKGKERMLGLFDLETKEGNTYTYEEFVTGGAKKYAVKEHDPETGEDKIHITVSGVPKSGAKALKGDLKNFKDNLVFRYEDTKKSILFYTDNQESVEMTDYNGVKCEVTDKSGCCLVPNTYTLAKSLEYASLLDDSSSRAKYKE